MKSICEVHYIVDWRTKIHLWIFRIITVLWNSWTSL